MLHFEVLSVFPTFLTIKLRKKTLNLFFFEIKYALNVYSAYINKEQYHF